MKSLDGIYIYKSFIYCRCTLIYQICTIMKHIIKKYDVIIVGGGPSGCTSAYNLLDANKKVLIMDKTSFPRHKPCAGGITMKTINHLPIKIDHLIQHTAREMKFSFNNKKSIHLSHENGSCVMVIRDKFDEYFFNETVKKGAEFQKINKIENINVEDENITLVVDGNTYNTNFLIGADGANSAVRKISTNLIYKNPVYAYEGIIDKMDDDCVTEFIFNEYGYAWIFPKDNHYNVGIGNLIQNKNSKKTSKKDLYAFVSDYFKTSNIRNITAFPIGTEGEYYQTTNNIFLVGDAAGFAESLLGEGIYNAVISGKYAAKAIIDSQNQNETASQKYNTFLDSFTEELKLYRKGSKILYGYPRLSYWMMKLGLGKKFMNGYSKGKTLTEIMGKTNTYLS